MSAIYPPDYRDVIAALEAKVRQMEQGSSTMSATPGPWRVVTNPHAPANFAVEAENGEYIGNVGVGFSESDARLIAAAPELLESLKSLMHGLDDYWQDQNPDAVAAARAAIAKAEGRS